MSAGTSGTGSSDGSSLSNQSLEVPKASIEIMEEDLLCPVCFSLYEEPQILRCAHSFCKTCLDGVIRNSAVTIANVTLRGSIIKCPVCRMEIFVRGTNGPKNSFIMKDIVDKYKLLVAAPKKPSCEVHTRQPLNIYCSTDQKPICGICATSEEHQDHIFSSSLDEAYTQEKIFLEQLIQELENRPSEQRNTLELAQGLRSVSEPLLFLQKMQEVREKVSLKQTPRSTVTDQSNPSHLQKTRCAPSTTSNSTWAWSAGVLLCTLLMAAFFTASFYGSDHIMSDHVTGEAVAPFLVYWNLAVKEIPGLTESWQDFFTWFINRAAEYAHSMIWMRGKEKEILQLAWEKKDTRTPSIKKTTAKPDEKPVQTGQMRPTIASNTTEMAYATMSNCRDLQTTPSAEETHLVLHQQGLMLLSYLSKAIRRAAERVSDYWWIIAKEIHHLGGRCHTYIQELADRLSELV